MSSDLQKIPAAKLQTKEGLVVELRSIPQEMSADEDDSSDWECHEVMPKMKPRAPMPAAPTNEVLEMFSSAGVAICEETVQSMATQYAYLLDKMWALEETSMHAQLQVRIPYCLFRKGPKYIFVQKSSTLNPSSGFNMLFPLRCTFRFVSCCKL